MTRDYVAVRTARCEYDGFSLSDIYRLSEVLEFIRSSRMQRRKMAYKVWKISNRKLKDNPISDYLECELKAPMARLN